jgi:hypothetical protein
MAEPGSHFSKSSMKLTTFTAENANEAVRLGAGKPGAGGGDSSACASCPPTGLRAVEPPGQIEVTAGVPEKPRHAGAARRRCLRAVWRGKQRGIARHPPPRAAHRWRSIAWLESLGLLPEFADRLELKLRTTHGTKPPEMPIAEWAAGARHPGHVLAAARPRGRRHRPAACVHRPAGVGQDDRACANG